MHRLLRAHVLGQPPEAREEGLGAGEHLHVAAWGVRAQQNRPVLDLTSHGAPDSAHAPPSNAGTAGRAARAAHLTWLHAPQCAPQHALNAVNCHAMSPFIPTLAGAQDGQGRRSAQAAADTASVAKQAGHLVFVSVPPPHSPRPACIQTGDCPSCICTVSTMMRHLYPSIPLSLYLARAFSTQAE